MPNMLVVILFGLVLVTAVYLMFKNMTNSEHYVKLQKVLIAIEIHKNKNSFLQQLIRDSHSYIIDKISVKTEQLKKDSGEPSAKYEFLRRRLYSVVVEFWYLLESQIGEFQSEALTNLTSMYSRGREYKRMLLNDIKRMKYTDGYETWRQEGLQSLSLLVQARLKYLQSPCNCHNAMKLLCPLNYPSGLGSQLHHVVSCFMFGYGARRTVILNSMNWSYDLDGWEDIFKPVDKCGKNVSFGDATLWNGDDNVNFVTIKTENFILPRPPYLPLAIPHDLAERLSKLHEHPIVWLVGQIFYYIFQFNENTRNIVLNATHRINWSEPIVGIHIRRSDKVNFEASYHSLEEYMKAVDEYYYQLEGIQHIERRQVYLASDDAGVYAEIKKKYPNYNILGDRTPSNIPNVSNRYTKSSLYGIIVDFYVLSKCNYLVCTLSSNVCRAVYALKQTNNVDKTTCIRSLDDVYYYSQQLQNKRIVILSHKPKNYNEINIEPGDIVHIDGNHWDGYSKGTNLRTGINGLFPSFKIEKTIETERFPIFDVTQNCSAL